MEMSKLTLEDFRIEYHPKCHWDNWDYDWRCMLPLPGNPVIYALSVDDMMKTLRELHLIPQDAYPLPTGKGYCRLVLSVNSRDL